MSPQTNIVEVTPDNLTQHPQAICFLNPKHDSYRKKIGWVEEQFDKGLKIKLLYLEGERRPIGFTEYVPGEYCWRSVDAKGYMFIHCLLLSGIKYHNRGFGTQLIREVEKDAEGMSGVAVVTGDKSFTANKNIFIKNNYAIVSESGKDQLLAKRFNEDPLPSINDWESQLEQYRGLAIVYSRQCPWVTKFIDEVGPILKEKDLNPQIVELKTAAEAQKAPSVYGIFSLIYNGKLLADRYISKTRFMDIIEKEIKL